MSSKPKDGLKYFASLKSARMSFFFPNTSPSFLRPRIVYTQTQFIIFLSTEEAERWSWLRSLQSFWRSTRCSWLEFSSSFSVTPHFRGACVFSSSEISPSLHLLGYNEGLRFMGSSQFPLSFLLFWGFRLTGSHHFLSYHAPPWFFFFWFLVFFCGLNGVYELEKIFSKSPSSSFLMSFLIYG